MSDDKETRIRVMENGPYKVDKANLLRMRMILNVAGRPVKWERGQSIKHNQSYELCRCGASSNKPFCDWTAWKPVPTILFHFDKPRSSKPPKVYFIFTDHFDENA